MSPTRLPVIVATILLLFACVGAIDLYGQGAQQAPLRRISVTITQVKPEMIDAYIALVRDEGGVPLLDRVHEQAGLVERIAQKLTMGRVGSWYQCERHPVERVNGQEARQKLNQQVGLMLDTAETTILRLVSEISYAPSPR
jgi:hypothetical protein